MIGKEEPLIKQLARSRQGFSGFRDTSPQGNHIRSASQPPLQRAPLPKGYQPHLHQQQQQQQQQLRRPNYVRSPSTADLPNARTTTALLQVSTSQPDLTQFLHQQQQQQPPQPQQHFGPMPPPQSRGSSPVPIPLSMSRPPTPFGGGGSLPWSPPVNNQPDLVSSIYVAPADVFHETPPPPHTPRFEDPSLRRSASPAPMLQQPQSPMFSVSGGASNPFFYQDQNNNSSDGIELVQEKRQQQQQQQAVSPPASLPPPASGVSTSPCQDGTCQVCQALELAYILSGGDGEAFKQSQQQHQQRFVQPQQAPITCQEPMEVMVVSPPPPATPSTNYETTQATTASGSSSSLPERLRDDKRYRPTCTIHVTCLREVRLRRELLVSGGNYHISGN